MDTMFVFFLTFAIQAMVCFKGGKLHWKLLPLAFSLLVEAAGWVCVFVFPDPSAELAGAVLGVIFAGMYMLSGTILGWFVYGVIQAVQKLIRQ